MVGIGHERPNVGPDRGDVYVVDLPEVAGSVMRGPHPVVVVRSDRLRRSRTICVVPMTSSARAAELSPPFLVAVSGRDTGLSRDGYVRCDQVLTMPDMAFGTRAGRLSPAALERVDVALRFVLGL